jgi:hypothetical protein
LIDSAKVRNRRTQEEEDEQDDTLAERTVVLQEPENILNFILPRYASVRECIDACFD